MMTHLRNVVATILKRSFLFYKFCLQQKEKKIFLQTHFIPPKKNAEKFSIIVETYSKLFYYFLMVTNIEIHIKFKVL